MIQCVCSTVHVTVTSRTMCCCLDKVRGMKAGRRYNNGEEQTEDDKDRKWIVHTGLRTNVPPL